MQLLHLHWLTPVHQDQRGRLFVWSETGPVDLSSSQSRKKQAQPHPRDAGPQSLRRLIAAAGLPGELSAAPLVFWLPSNRFGPVSPSDLMHNREADDEPLTLRQWAINGLQLDTIQALMFFTFLHQYDLPPAIRLGADARYWQIAFTFVLELLARQLVRPALVQVAEKKGTRFESRWQSLLDGEDEARRAAQLVAGMPAVCRADAADPADAIPSRAILDSFLNHLSDTAVRHWTAKQVHDLPTDRDPAAAWLRALFAYDDPTIRAGTGQIQHLAGSFRAWERTLTVAGDKQYRVAMRLEAPAQQSLEPTNHGNHTWQLQYLLQARDDASLLVPAADVWDAKGGALQSLGHQFERPQERLLAGLGYAARFFQPIHRSLQQRSPTHSDLTSEEAYTFLRQCAPHLQRAGFGLLVPPWWNKPGTRLGVRLNLSSTPGMKDQSRVSKGHLNLQNLVKYRWQLSLGETALSREEFDALVALKSPLVQIRGQWVQLDPEQIESAIQFWQKHDYEGLLSIQEGMHLGLAGQSQHEGLAVDGVEFDDWLQRWLNRLQGDEKLELLPKPAGVQAELRPYQQYGYSWLHFAGNWGLGVILADDMGLGKTVQALTMIQRLKEDMGRLPAPILLICPTSVVTNWEMEKDKFTPGLRTWMHQGGDRLREDALVEAAKTSDMLLTSYALMRRDGATLTQIDWFGVILDEAQNIKNAGTKQAQTIRKLKADFRLALTGTPVENRLSELWSIMNFLNPGFLGGQKVFRQEFILPIEKYGDEVAAQKLRKMIRPLLLRRVKTDSSVIHDLPDKQEVKVYCHLSEEQATLYEVVVRDALAAIDEQEEGGITRKGLVLSMLMQLKQVCNHPAQYLHETKAYRPDEDHGRSGKLQRFDALLDEILAEGDRLLIFSQFTEMAGLLESHIQQRFGIPTLFLHGGVPGKKRAAMVAQFQQPDGPPVFLLSLKAGGTGLNLTRANHVFHFDRWWNPAVEDQATDRAFRIGQTKNVLVHKFVCLGTLEERIDAMIEDKKALAETIIGSGENWLTDVSTATLREMVSLRRV